VSGPERGSAKPATAPIGERTAWVVVIPTDDVPGEWLAHCLDLNVMSQGRSLSHALDMVIEAVDLVLEEDRKAGLDPFDRTAPPEEWAAFAEHMRRAELTTLDELVRGADDGTLEWMATKLAIPLPAENRQRHGVHKVAQAAVQHAGAAA
jgi:predicted RNase H-like HicB family nuclease